MCAASALSMPLIPSNVQQTRPFAPSRVRLTMPRPAGAPFGTSALPSSFVATSGCIELSAAGASTAATASAGMSMRNLIEPPFGRGPPASSLLSLLHLAQDTLNKVAIAMLLLVAATLVVPKAGEVLERPFLFLTRRRGGDLGGGFLLGASLGLVFVPCAGPVLGAVTTIAAEHRIGVETVLLTLFYALGTGSVLLLIALGGQRVVGRLRVGGDVFRRVLGV